MEERVFETFNRMYEVFERDRRLIPAGQFCEVRYEDLVKDPVGQMRRAYEELALGDFDGVAEQVRRYFADKADYKKNRFEMSRPVPGGDRPPLGPVLERFGYAEQTTRSSP